MDNESYTKPIFHIIHPSIIDLYVNALILHILQEQLTNLGPNNFSLDKQTEIDKATTEYVISVKRAEELYKDFGIVQKQLDAFVAQRQGDA